MQEKDRLVAMPKKSKGSNLNRNSKNSQIKKREREEKGFVEQEREAKRLQREDSNFKEKEKQSQADYIWNRRQDSGFKNTEKNRDKEYRKEKRSDASYRAAEALKDCEYRKKWRMDDANQISERLRRRNRMLNELELEARREQDVQRKRINAERKQIKYDLEALLNDINLDDQPENDYGIDIPNAPNEELASKRREYISHVLESNFDFNIFDNNPLIEAGKDFYRDLESFSSKECVICMESYIGNEIGPRSGKCKRCSRNPQLFALSNDLTPPPPPPCLSQLTPIEKSAISIICPVLVIYKTKGGTSNRGHTISFQQEVDELATTLPRIPEDLPFIVVKGRNEQIEDKIFRVRKQKIIDALLYLKANNEDYAGIKISVENANAYPEDGVPTNLTTVSKEDMSIRDEDEHTADNPESVNDNETFVDAPMAGKTVVEQLKQMLGTQTENQNNEDGQRRDVARNQCQWPTRSTKPASEYCIGYFSKAFPDLFPDGRGDITKPREGKNPTKAEYFKHLIRLHRSFLRHHSFVFVACNMLRRHEAISRSNVFAKKMCENMTLQDLKAAVNDGNDSVIKKLLFFAAPIQGTTQYFKVS